MGDLFRKKEKAPKPPKKFMALVLPNVSSNPSNGFLLGVGGTFGWYMGPKENEWRFPIWPCSNIIGGVIFVNATTTDNPTRGIALFQYVQPAVGFGIRVMVNKYFRTNINLDFAIGHQSQGFYFSGQETF